MCNTGANKSRRAHAAVFLQPNSKQKVLRFASHLRPTSHIISVFNYKRSTKAAARKPPKTSRSYKNLHQLSKN